MVLHMGSATFSGDACTNVPTTINDVVTSGTASESGEGYFVYVLASPQYPENPAPEIEYGLRALQFGIAVDPPEAVVIHQWQSCAVSSIFGNGWPQSGSGILLTLDGCRQSELTVAGYFFLSAYAPATMSVTPWPGEAAAKYVDCQSLATDFFPVSSHRVGWISMGGALRGQDADGCNPLLGPCDGPVPVEPTTWGRLKAKFPAGS